MAAIRTVSASNGVEVEFAKLQGEDFEYYMQTYSIILGRNSKKCIVDVDLSSLGGGKKISRHHACIFFDFTRHWYSLEVLGKNGCLVQGILYLPENPPVKLNSQDLIQIGDKKFYFMLPMRRISRGPVGPRHCPHHMVVPIPMIGAAFALNYNYHLAAAAAAATDAGTVVKKGKRNYYEDDVGGSNTKKSKTGEYEHYWYGGVRYGGTDLLVRAMDKKSEGRSRIDRHANNLQLQQLEEKNVLSSVATVLSDLCGPGYWMPMDKLHAELVEQYSSVWHHRRVRRYLTSEDWPGPESKGKPWYGLLMLLRKYPENFDINTKPKGYHWIHHPLYKSLIPLLMPGVLLPNDDEVEIFVCLKETTYTTACKRYG